jgi:preprotein translocase subunit YajC
MDLATVALDVLTLLIVIASFLAIRDNRKQTKEALAEGNHKQHFLLH